MKKLTKLKTSIISLCAVVCAVILGLSISLSGVKSADAYVTSTNFNDTSKYTVIPEITNTSGASVGFNSANLTRLFSVLLGDSTNSGTISKLRDYVSGTTTMYDTFTLPTYYTSANLRANNGNKEIIINFGGYEWFPTLLTRTGGGDETDSDVILTLMLAKISGDTSKWCVCITVTILPIKLNRTRRLCIPSAIFAQQLLMPEGITQLRLLITVTQKTTLLLFRSLQTANGRRLPCRKPI